MTITPEELRTAAAILRKASEAYGALNPTLYPWSAHGLEHEANYLEMNADE